MKANLFLLLLSVAGGALHAQNNQASTMNQTTRDAFNITGLGMGANAVSGITSIRGKSGNVQGDAYLDSSWRQGSIKLYKKIGPLGREGDSIANVPIRLDLYQNELEIQMTSANDIRGMKADLVRFFSLDYGVPKVYINTQEFRGEDDLKGFVELIVAGRVSLVQHNKLTVIKPTYNEALGTGNKDTRISKNAQYYYLRGSLLTKLGTSKKKVLEAFADQADAIEKFLKENDLNLKERADLARVFAYYNSL